MTNKLYKALVILTKEVNYGAEFPDALYKVSKAHNVDSDSLKKVYDEVDGETYLAVTADIQNGTFDDE